jgi:hypothetical protein
MESLVLAEKKRAAFQTSEVNVDQTLKDDTTFPNVRIMM